VDNQVVVATGIFLVTYALIISEKIHRTIVAIMGGLAMQIITSKYRRYSYSNRRSAEHNDW